MRCLQKSNIRHLHAKPDPNGITVKRPFWSLCVLALLLGFAQQARAADFFADNESRRAILDLRQRYLELSEENTRMREALQAIRSQMDALKTDLNRLREQEERNRRELEERQQKISSIRSDGGNLMPENALATDTAAAPLLHAADASQEKAAFNAGLNKFRASDYAGAQAALSTFLQQYPQSSRRISGSASPPGRRSTRPAVS